MDHCYLLREKIELVLNRRNWRDSLRTPWEDDLLGKGYLRKVGVSLPNLSISRLEKIPI